MPLHVAGAVQCLGFRARGTVRAQSLCGQRVGGAVGAKASPHLLKGESAPRQCTVGPGRKIAKTTPCKVELCPGSQHACCAASRAREESGPSSWPQPL